MKDVCEATTYRIFESSPHLLPEAQQGFKVTGVLVCFVIGQTLAILAFPVAIVLVAAVAYTTHDITY